MGTEDIKSKLSKWLGSWIDGPMALLDTVIVLLLACSKAFEIGEPLSRPEFRWLVWLLIIVLSLGAFFLRKPKSTILDSDGRPLPTKNKWATGQHLLVALLTLAVLAIDLNYSLSSYLVPLDVTGPYPTRSGVTLVMKREDAERMQKIPVWSFAAQKELSLDDVEPHAFDLAISTLGFDLRKKGSWEEIVVHDVVLIVEGHESLPEYSVTYGAGHPYVDATKLYFQVGIKKEPLPWEFHPSYVVDDGEARIWDGHLSLQDAFARPMRIVVFGKDAGIYRIKVKLLVDKKFGGTKLISLPDRPIGLAFFGKEGRIPEEEVAKLDVVYIGANSKISEYPGRSPSSIGKLLKTTAGN